jgi:hypothetical protein
MLSSKKLALAIPVMVLCAIASAAAQSFTYDVAQGFRKPAAATNALYEAHLSFGPMWPLDGLPDENGENASQPLRTLAALGSVGWGNPGVTFTLSGRFRQKLADVVPIPLPSMSLATTYLRLDAGYSLTLADDPFSRDRGGSFYGALGFDFYLGIISFDLGASYMFRTELLIPRAGLSIYL